MKIISIKEIELFGEKVIAELVEYEIDITYNSYPYKEVDGKRKITIVRKIRIKYKEKPDFSKFVKENKRESQGGKNGN